MTLFEALPDDITKALFSYCKDDECLNDAMLRALRNELKIDQVEHDKYSHDCLRCDKLKEKIKNYKEMCEDMKADMCGTNNEVLYDYLSRLLKKYKEIVGLR